MIGFASETEKYDFRWEEAIEEAEAQGKTVVHSNRNVILLDLDNKESFYHYETMFPILRAFFNLTETDTWRSSSGKGRHVVLACDPLDFPTRIALQAALGSDRKREGLALAMLKEGHGEHSFLFKPASSRQ